MRINRTEHTSRFTIIDNSFMRSGTLSIAAVGILAFLLSCSEEFKPSERGLAKMFPNGRDAIRTALNELESAGYLVRDKVRGKDGKIVGYEWTVNEVPGAMDNDGDSPWLDFPATDNPPKEVPIEEEGPSHDSRDGDATASNHEDDPSSSKEGTKVELFSGKQRRRGWVLIPTLAEVNAFVLDHMPEFEFLAQRTDIVKGWYDAQMSRGWTDRLGNQIADWKMMLRGLEEKCTRDCESRFVEGA